MTYELWDMDSGNLIGGYDRKQDALDVVRENARQHGKDVVRGVALLSIGSRGKGQVVAEGDDLLLLAQPDRAARK